MKISRSRLADRGSVGYKITNEIDKNRRARPKHYVPLKDRPVGIPKVTIKMGGSRKRAPVKITRAGRQS